MIFGINTTRDIAKLSQISLAATHLIAREIFYNNFEISLVVFMPNITINQAITYTNTYQNYAILVAQIAFYYIVAGVALMTTSSGQRRPVIPRHVTTRTCAVQSVLAHLFSSINRTLGCLK